MIFTMYEYPPAACVSVDKMTIILVSRLRGRPVQRTQDQVREIFRWCIVRHPIPLENDRKREDPLAVFCSAPVVPIDVEGRELLGFVS